MLGLGKLKKKAEGIVLNQIVALVLKKAQAGDFGPFVKKVYDVTDGHKAQIGAAIAAPGAVLLALDQAGTCAAFAVDCGHWMTQWGVVLTGLGSLGFAVGQVDGARKMAAPSQEITKAAKVEALKAELKKALED